MISLDNKLVAENCSPSPLKTLVQMFLSLINIVTEGEKEGWGEVEIFLDARTLGREVRFGSVPLQELNLYLSLRGGLCPTW